MVLGNVHDTFLTDITIFSFTGTVRYPFPPAGPFADSINGAAGYPAFNPAVAAVAIHSTTDHPAVSHGGAILNPAAHPAPDSGNHVPKPENPSPVH